MKTLARWWKNLLRWLLRQDAGRATTFIVANDRGEEIRMLKLTTIERTTLHARPVNEKGGDAPIDGVSAWSASIDGVVQLFPTDDGRHCEVAGVAPGTCQVWVKGDADLTEGQELIQESIDIEVVMAKAVGFEMSADPVTLQE